MSNNPTEPQGPGPAGSVLQELLDEGLSRADLARATGYPARALRDGTLAEQDPTTAAALTARLADVGSVLSILREAGSADPAALLEIPLVDGWTVRGWDLYLNAMLDRLVRIAAGEPADQVLELGKHDWRSRYRSDYEVFPAEDGHHSIRLRGDSR